MSLVGSQTIWPFLCRLGLRNSPNGYRHEYLQGGVIQFFPLAREKKIIKIFAQDFLRLIAQQLLHHRAGIECISLGVHLPNPLRGVLGDIPEPLLAFP